MKEEMFAAIKKEFEKPGMLFLVKISKAPNGNFISSCITPDRSTQSLSIAAHALLDACNPDQECSCDGCKRALTRLNASKAILEQNLPGKIDIIYSSSEDVKH